MAAISIFKKRMLVLMCLLQDGEKTTNQLLDLDLFKIEKASMNVIMRQLCRDGFLIYRVSEQREYVYRVTDAFKQQLKAGLQCV